MKHYQRSYTHAIQTACTSRQGGRSVKVSVKICAEFFFMIERREGSSLWVYTQISQARESAYGPWIGHAFAKLITFSISASNELGAMLHTFLTFHSGKKIVFICFSNCSQKNFRSNLKRIWCFELEGFYIGTVSRAVTYLKEIVVTVDSLLHLGDNYMHLLQMD